jgi:lysozyme
VTLREQLVRDEGLKLRPYTDSTGHLTIGYGYNLSNGIPKYVADALLDFKMNEAADDVHRTLTWAVDLSEPRRDALVNMTYNMGIGGLLGFRRMLAAMKSGDWTTAAKEMLDSTWATQVGDRAHRLSQQVLTDTII